MEELDEEIDDYLERMNTINYPSWWLFLIGSAACLIAGMMIGYAYAIGVAS